MSEDEDSITEAQVRNDFEEVYGVTIEEVIGVLEQCLEENHRLLKGMKEVGEEVGFTDAERESMRDIQDYVDERNES
ncbi:hypothetical protein [Haloplanus salilacus]|uniref:hypothetical protein n=1 Tax=Haloplanus salilacus TaxID=2949994 RepID=UPI0030CD5374